MSAVANVLGIRALLQFGSGAVLMPAEPDLMEAIEELEIQVSAERGAHFRLVLSAERSGPLGVFGPPFVDDSRFQSGGRIGISLFFAVKPVPIIHGVIVKSQYLPPSDAHDGKVVLLGTDLSGIMNREHVQTPWPALAPNLIATAILAKYIADGIVPKVMPPQIFEQPNPLETTPVQSCTDLAYLRRLARDSGHHAVLQPGPAPGTSTFYWGPLPIMGLPQKTLSVDLGPMSDAFGVTITHNGHQITTAGATVIDRQTGQRVEVDVPGLANMPQGAVPEWQTRQGQTRRERLAVSGMTGMQARAIATARLQATAEKAVQARGTINNVRYNDALQPFQQVFLRGVGAMFGGLYTVSEVRHRLRPGDYSQTFTLQRAELYALAPVVPPETQVA
ncbi:MAG: hypothetical protein AAFY47_07585 [Pseudomonadota bacterium]